MTTLIVPGINDSGPGHWQTWVQTILRDSIRVNQDDWARPDLDIWADRIASAIIASDTPPIIVAHSFGVLATVQAMQAAAPVAAVMLVAPADPAIFGCEKVLSRKPLKAPAVLVASRNDPWMAFERTAKWAARWNANLLDLGHAGHINRESGHGPWPTGLRIYRELEHGQRTIAHASTGAWSLT